MTTHMTPRFRTVASTGQTLCSESFRGKTPVAMTFFPDPYAASETLAAYNTAHADLAQRRVQLLAVVPKTASGARQIADRAQLTFPVLADPAGTMFREFDATTDHDELRACSVIIDKTGTVAWITEGVVSAEEMTARLNDLEESNRFEMAVSR